MKRAAKKSTSQTRNDLAQTSVVDRPVALGATTPELELHVKGSAVHVHNLLASIASEPALLWNLSTARTIARVQTRIADATIDDILNGPKIRYSNNQQVTIYEQRCIDAAKNIGVSIDERRFKSPLSLKSSVKEVGDALFSSGL